MSNIPEKWKLIIDKIIDAVSKHGHDLNHSNFKFATEDESGHPGGEIEILGGYIFVCEIDGDLYMDYGVDASDPSIGEYIAIEPADDPKLASIDSIAKEIADTLSEWEDEFNEYAEY